MKTIKRLTQFLILALLFVALTHLFLNQFDGTLDPRVKAALAEETQVSPEASNVMRILANGPSCLNLKQLTPDYQVISQALLEAKDCQAPAVTFEPLVQRCLECVQPLASSPVVDLFLNEIRLEGRAGQTKLKDYLQLMTNLSLRGQTLQLRLMGLNGVVIGLMFSKDWMRTTGVAFDQIRPEGLEKLAATERLEYLAQVRDQEIRNQARALEKIEQSKDPRHFGVETTETVHAGILEKGLSTWAWWVYQPHRTLNAIYHSMDEIFHEATSCQPGQSCPATVAEKLGKPSFINSSGRVIAANSARKTEIWMAQSLRRFNKVKELLQQPEFQE